MIKFLLCAILIISVNEVRAFDQFKFCMEQDLRIGKIIDIQLRDNERLCKYYAASASETKKSESEQKKGICLSVMTNYAQNVGQSPMYFKLKNIKKEHDWDGKLGSIPTVLCKQYL
jgi:hypothetical protein